MHCRDGISSIISSWLNWVAFKRHLEMLTIIGMPAGHKKSPVKEWTKKWLQDLCMVCPSTKNIVCEWCWTTLEFGMTVWHVISTLQFPTKKKTWRNCNWIPPNLKTLECWLEEKTEKKIGGGSQAWWMVDYCRNPRFLSPKILCFIGPLDQWPPGTTGCVNFTQ